jgi:hypothetical protein
MSGVYTTEDSAKRLYAMLTARLIVLILVLLCIAPASAITATGLKYVGSIPAGGTDTFKMTVGSNLNDNPTDIVVEVMGFGQGMNSLFTPLNPVDDINPYSARTFITLDKTTFHLEPGTSQPITATIALPKNVGSGGRYALIYIHALPGQGQAAITTGILVPVAITISGTTPTVTGSITGVDVGSITVGQPIVVTTTFKNTGNYYGRHMVNQVKLTDGNGNILANASTQPLQNAIIPGNMVQYTVIPDLKDLQVGTYTVDSKILNENSQILDEKTATFTVKTNYVPPVTESNITLTPGSAGILTSPDGRYSISFPLGAVLGDAVVTLKPYSHDKLPSAPADASLGATCFEITGLSGLLSKDATVTVTYSADDLTAAGGDTSKLKLSYYDAVQNSWVILPTQVDAGKTTLTTTTNHLSVWAVMVSSSTPDGTASEATPAATATKSPVPLTVILASLILAGVAVKKRFWKRE